jgi:hypothetical protein
LNKPFEVGFSIVTDSESGLPTLEIVFRYQEGETDISKTFKYWESDVLNNGGFLIAIRERMDSTMRSFLESEAVIFNIDEYLPELIFATEQEI